MNSPAAHKGIWHSVGATTSWVHSPRWSKSFAGIEKVSTQPKFSIWIIRETLIDDNQVRIRENKINPDEWKGMLWLLVNVSSFDLSLFLAFPLHSNVDSACYCLVIKNWRILPQNGNLLLRIESLYGIIILPLRDDMICPSVVIICSESWIFCLLIWTPLSLVHSPRHNSRRRSLLMLLLSHSDTHYLAGVYGRMRVPRNLDFLFYNCPVLHHFSSDFYFSRWGWERGWVHIGSLESKLRATIVSDGTSSIHHQASLDFSGEDRSNT